MVHAVGLAGAVVDGIVQAPCEASVLFPTSGGNIHSLTALTPAAILDVLSPPYSAELGRPSTYYSEVPFLPGKLVSCMYNFLLDLYFVHQVACHEFLKWVFILLQRYPWFQISVLFLLIKCSGMREILCLKDGFD